MSKRIKDHRASNALIDLASTLSRQKDIDDIFKIVGQKSAELLRADAMLILMFNPQTHDTLKTILRQGQTTESSQYRYVQNQVSGWISKHNESLFCPDIRTDERFHKACFEDSFFCSVLGAPLRNEDTIIGTLIAFSTTKSQFVETDLPFLENIALIAAPYLHHVEKLAPYFIKPLPKSKLLSKYRKNGLIGQSQTFIELLKTIDAATCCDVRVLLEGQSGTGKELVARAIHSHSSRQNGPFVAVDCGAIPASLMESELFGHVKGAFTGATSDRKGLFEEAQSGTLFMDEIINLPIEMQSKLMRVLQENEIRPVGSNKPRKVDVRIIAAASNSLQNAVKTGDFREDLYYRLFVYPISIPTLDERNDDIPVLSGHFLTQFAKQQNKSIDDISLDLQRFLKQRQWRGNIRELENFIERLVTLAPDYIKKLDKSILPAKLAKAFEKADLEMPLSANISLSELMAEYEGKIIRRALDLNSWIQSQTDRSLKISVQSLRYKMAKLGIESQKK